jgi:hypothetical protein
LGRFSPLHLFTVGFGVEQQLNALMNRIDIRMHLDHQVRDINISLHITTCPFSFEYETLYNIIPTGMLKRKREEEEETPNNISQENRK